MMTEHDIERIVKTHGQMRSAIIVAFCLVVASLMVTCKIVYAWMEVQ